METISFESLRQEDLALRQRKELDQIEQIADKEKEEFVKEVKEFIARCRQSGDYIADEEERDFLRAILRYWGTFVYNASGMYPPVELNDLIVPPPKRHIKLSLASLLVTGVLVLLVGAVSTLFVLRYPSILVSVIASPTATALSVSAVTLTTPQNGQAVPCSVVARGSYPLDLTDDIWPLVYFNGRYYPQSEGGTAAQKVEGTWYQTVRFGDCNNLQQDVGRIFQLVIVTADELANTEFERYIKVAQATGNWPGITGLPSGSNEQISIMVIRQ